MQFPPSIELCRSSYSRNLSGEQTRQTFDAWQRHRRKVRNRGVTDTVCWIVNQRQCDLIKQFHRVIGGDYFKIDLPAYCGIIATIARFDGPLTIKPLCKYFEITASLYVPNPPVMSNEQLANELLADIGVTDGTFDDPLHDFIHTKWSSQWSFKS